MRLFFFFWPFLFFSPVPARATEKMLLIRLVERKWLLNSTTSWEGNNKIWCYYLKMQRERCRNQLPRALPGAGGSPRRGGGEEEGAKRERRRWTRLPGPRRDPSGIPRRIPPGEGLHRHTLPRGWHLAALFYVYLYIYIYVCFHGICSKARNSHAGKRRAAAAGSARPRRGRTATSLPPDPLLNPAGAAHTRTDGRTPPHTPLPPAHVGAASPRRPPAPVPREPLSPSPAAHRVAQLRLLAEHRVPHGRGRAAGPLPPHGGGGGGCSGAERCSALRRQRQRGAARPPSSVCLSVRPSPSFLAAPRPGCPHPAPSRQPLGGSPGGSGGGGSRRRGGGGLQSSRPAPVTAPAPLRSPSRPHLRGRTGRRREPRPGRSSDAGYRARRVKWPLEALAQAPGRPGAAAAAAAAAAVPSLIPGAKSIRAARPGSEQQLELGGAAPVLQTGTQRLRRRGTEQNFTF